jgi:lipid A 3-O-deacylase
MPWEYGVLAQGGVGLTENRDNFRFLMAGVHLGKVLTNNSGHRVWSGQFEWAGEFFPYWQSFTPSFQRANCYPTGSVPPGVVITQSAPGAQCTADFTTGGTYTGTTITPVILRWNFTHVAHSKRFMPWAQAAGGLLWTNHKYPSFGSPVLSLSQDGPATETSVFNFTPQGGVGFHYFLDDQHSIDFSANGIHISSASLGDKNPGVNASVQFSLGYTWWR